MIAENHTTLARRVLDQVASKTSFMESSSERSLLIAKMAKLYARLGDQEAASKYFDKALQMRGEGREGAVTQASIAINQAHALMFTQSRETIHAMENHIISESVETELDAIIVLSKTFPTPPGG